MTGSPELVIHGKQSEINANRGFMIEKEEENTYVYLF
jgi:hypothetical protein